jgi:hypothetical protein
MTSTDPITAAMDAETLRHAALMAQLTRPDQILEYFASIDPRMAELYSDSPYAAAYGRAAALMGEMAAIIRRQQAQIEKWDLAAGAHLNGQASA